MKDSLYDRLWRRESGELSPEAGLRGIYGSKEWINDLDIVNELSGHTGCVNALSWSRSGRLLASGSDDQHLNIYSYQPESSTAPFALDTTVLTGHRANIFSVKFMPHSNDRTLVTCAGDSQVRVFDIEYSSSNGNAATTSAFTASARSQRFNNFFSGVRYLSEGNTNARIYRSHADRVKRIVTESSPYLFLTCSEDGEVRQWDLRQPSTAYPPPRGGQGFMSYRPGLEHDDSNVPPPLISYKKFNLDLNTISCSPSQPHYIALGGAHLHCFLHDRRMLGRDKLAERGSPPRSSSSPAAHDDDAMGKATRCVRRFAPGGKRRMKHLDNGHITACKISDANPDEMVVSWSGDHIYSFDLIRSPDARDVQAAETSTLKSSNGNRKRERRSRKRKRPKPESMSSQESGGRHQSRRRSAELDTFSVRYGNGDLVDNPALSDSMPDSPEGLLERARYSVLNEAQRLSMQIAKGLVKLRRSLFSLEITARQATESDDSDIAPCTAAFSSALSLASRYLPQMDEVIRNWSYPMNPNRQMVSFQQSLRANRQASWRFVQAAGTLARALGGRVEPETDQEQAETETDFQVVRPAPGEDESISQEEQFGYDFLKAILLWLDGGRPALLAGFKRDGVHRRYYGRLPIPADAGEETIDTILVPYLHQLAGDAPVVNVDASRFEHDATRILFQTQRAAVTAFGNAVRLPLENLEISAARIDRRRASSSSSHVRSLDRSSATRFWILRVGRGLLMEAGQGVNFTFVNRAFGGLLATVNEDSDSDLAPERSQDDIDPDLEEELIRNINLVRTGSSTRLTGRGREAFEANAASSMDFDTDGIEASLFEPASSDHDEEREEAEDSSDDGDADENEGEDDAGWDLSLGSDDDSDDEQLLAQRYGVRKTLREDVDIDVPCSSQTRVYRGHCNVKTVKDVNFFGLNDEYVVSGSDSGHVFIWERKNAKLVNILEGDSEVVNVVQGHPYEPTIAASGIDNTIKIFSPDRRAQEDARLGINVLDPDYASNAFDDGRSGECGLRSRKRIHDSYRIMSQNDVERRGGMSEAFITRSMLARLASSLRGRQAFAGGAGGLGGGAGEGATIVLDENCLVM